MNNLIAEAIANRRLLEFRYDNHPRVVEPHLLGVNKAGHLILSAYQVAGGSNSGKSFGWRPFLLSKISGLSISEDTFSGERVGYNPNDSTMQRILARI